MSHAIGVNAIAVYENVRSLTLQNVSITRFRGAQSGGALLAFDVPQMSLHDVLLADNSAETGGALALYFRRLSESQLLYNASNLVVRHNQASVGGAAYLSPLFKSTLCVVYYAFHFNSQLNFLH